MELGQSKEEQRCPADALTAHLGAKVGPAATPGVLPSGSGPIRAPPPLPPQPPSPLPGQNPAPTPSTAQGAAQHSAEAQPAAPLPPTPLRCSPQPHCFQPHFPPQPSAPYPSPQPTRSPPASGGSMEATQPPPKLRPAVKVALRPLRGGSFRRTVPGAAGFGGGGGGGAGRGMLVVAAPTPPRSVPPSPPAGLAAGSASRGQEGSPPPTPTKPRLCGDGGGRPQRAPTAPGRENGRAAAIPAGSGPGGARGGRGRRSRPAAAAPYPPGAPHHPRSLTQRRRPALRPPPAAPSARARRHRSRLPPPARSDGATAPQRPGGELRGGTRGGPGRDTGRVAISGALLPFPPPSPPRPPHPGTDTQRRARLRAVRCCMRAVRVQRGSDTRVPLSARPRGSRDGSAASRPPRRSRSSRRGAGGTGSPNAVRRGSWGAAGGGAAVSVSCPGRAPAAPRRPPGFRRPFPHEPHEEVVHIPCGESAVSPRPARPGPLRAVLSAGPRLGAAAGPGAVRGGRHLRF